LKKEAILQVDRNLNMLLNRLTKQKYYLSSMNNEWQGIEKVYTAQFLPQEALEAKVPVHYFAGVKNWARIRKNLNRLKITFFPIEESPYFAMSIQLLDRKDKVWRKVSDFGSFQYQMGGGSPSEEDLLTWMESTIVLCTFK
jgi:hypothetical protein